MEKIKVVHVITRFDKGGSAENTFLTVRDLDKNRYEVVLITGASSRHNAQDPEALASEAGINTAREHNVRVICIPDLVRDLRPYHDLAAFLCLFRIIRREKPRIAHTHTSKAGILGRWAAFFAGVPVIIHTPHGHVFWGYFPPMRTRLFILLERWTARITAAMVMLTHQEREDHLNFGIAPENKFNVIHSGINLEMFQDAGSNHTDIKAALGIPPETAVVGTAGRLTAVKGQDVLIRAASELIRRGKRIFLVFLGDGELRQELEQLTVRLGIEEYVRFLGWRPDVAEVMSVFDLFVLPSLNEGMGRVLVEAMALGKPIVASDVGGISDLVVHGRNGCLVPPGDVLSLSAAISDLLENPEKGRIMGEHGKKIAVDYSADAMVQKIDLLYRTILQQKHII